MKCNIIFRLVFIFVLLSCQEDCMIYQVDEYQNDNLNSTSLLIDKDIIDLEKEDAEKIAQNFFNINVKTRSRQISQVKNIQAVLNEAGNPVAYVVNYKNGFVIVSATKLYDPVIAFSDNGYIDCLQMTGGLKYWFDAVTDDIDQNKRILMSDSSLYWEYRNKWAPYEKEEQSLYTELSVKNHSYWFPITKDIILNKGASWRTDRQQYCYIMQSKYNVFESLDYLEHTDSELERNYKNTGYIPPSFVWGECLNGTIVKKINPILKTYWGCGNPYNTYKKNATSLSSSAVAIGQLLNYRNPLSIDGVKIDWTKTDVPYLLPDSNNEEIPKMLALLDSTITAMSFEHYVSKDNRDYVYNIYGIGPFLRRNGFFVNSQNGYDSSLFTTILNEIKNYHPVYVEINSIGALINTTLTAFVCDGYYEEWAEEGIIAYRTDQVQNKNYDTNPYVMHVDKTTSKMYSQFVHINWGDGTVVSDFYPISSANGWYKSIFDIDKLDQYAPYEYCIASIY